jgi:DinB superfamily
MLTPCRSLIVVTILAAVGAPSSTPTRTLRASGAPLPAGPLTTGDRQRVLSHLEMTESWLVSELEGLSAAQLTFQMSPDSWSIQEVVEHLAIAEPQYWQQLQDSLKQPLGYKSESTDAAILWYGIDRTNRQRTGEARVPKGKYENVKQSLGDFRKLRTTMMEFTKTTEEDLRGRQLQGGNMDVYQWLLMISTHSQRHILQIREIKADRGYPKH